MSTARPEDLAPDIEVFARTFADAPELDETSASARRVLAVAAALFNRHGAAATSVRDITSRCGLTPGALYRHFASKDDLLYTLVDYGHQRMERRVAEALDDAEPDPVARLAAFVRAYVTGHLAQPELAQLVRREYLHLSEPRYRSVVRRRRGLRAQLADLLREGAEAGALDLLGRPNDSADGATRIAVMLLDMCSRTSDWYHPRSAQPPRQLAELYTAAALRLAGAALSPDAVESRRET